MGAGVFWFVFACSVALIAGSKTKEDELAKFIKSDKIMDVTDFSIYYDLKTNETIKEMLPRPWYWPGWMLRLPFQGGPCQCQNLECMCCTGIHFLNINRKSCANLTYDPEQSTIGMEVTMQNSTVYKNTFSARNPPPFCIPVPVPYLPPGLVDMCIRLFNISIVDQKLHVCMDIDSRIDMSPVLVLHFDCMDMGLNGVNYPVKPGGGPTPSDTTMEPEQVDSDIFDPVTESQDTSRSKKIKKFRNVKDYLRESDILNYY